MIHLSRRTRKGLLDAIAVPCIFGLLMLILVALDQVLRVVVQ